MSGKDRWLLPEGFEELLPNEARRVETMRRRVIDLFHIWGYDLVMPPMIEYLDSLLTGVGKELDLQTFKIVDQLTGRLMGIRPDMTPQAACIDAHYLKRTVPVRLCYLGPVLHARPDQFAGSREPLQLGAELFGHAGIESDVEVLCLMVATLELAGVKDLHIDLGHVGVFRGLMAAANLDEDDEAELFDALQAKAAVDVSRLLEACGASAPIKRMLLSLIDLNGGAEVLSAAKKCFESAPPAVVQALENLEAVAAAVNRQLPDRPFYFDLAELTGYRYYTGAVFSAFVPAYGRAVARGGRYDGIGKAFGRARPATGFGADLRELLKLLAAEESEPQGILAPCDDDAAVRAEIARLRATGERVVVCLPGVSLSAQDSGCDRELVQKDGRWVVAKAR
ncbi:MAG: ATP phosphoribosyltransferase regulatory subunit [Gammaproteobacteria bacterium]|nr:MAG: ATP phosphoribosyltransferase regulatory subunit [Gammaproteobacteria bacterium]